MPAGSVQHVIAVGDAVPGSLAWTSLAQFPPDSTPCPVNIDAPYVLLYTSGTTTSPKGILTPARRFVHNACQAVVELNITERDVVLSAAPFTHLYGLFALQCALIAGASLSLMPAFSPTDLTATVRRDRPTMIFAGPAHFKPLLDQDLMRPADYASTRLLCLSGTTVPPALARAVEAQLPAGVVIQLWGMSELQAGSYGRPNDPPAIRHETAGRAAPGIDLQIVGDDNRPLPVGQEGRLRVKGPSVFDAYLNNPAESSACLVDGWFDTGDTAMMREDAGLVITGRVKELINRGGVKFNPVDVEAILDRVSGVARCILAPMPDPILGERTCAFVQRNGTSPVTLESLVQALERAGVAKFKWPERLEFVDEFPLTPTQKVRRPMLTALITARLTTGQS
jgi:acyl-coenzyme A synthetase/AMP-(fatty) acid ligase